MSNITVKSIPRALHEKLRKRAGLHRRSLNSEILACLESSVSSALFNEEVFLRQVQRLREQIKGRLKDSELRTLKVQGRP